MPNDMSADSGTLERPADAPAVVPSSAVPKQAPIFAPLTAQSDETPTGYDIDLVLDIPVQLTVELGRTKMPIRNLLRLSQGSLIELGGRSGEPLDILVNGCLIAQGEVVVVGNDRFGIRLTDIVTPSERMRRLRQ